MTLIAIITGIAALVLYSFVTNATIPLILACVIQGALLLVTIIVAFLYRGPRSHRSYDGGWYSIWTLRFGLIMFSLLGNLAIFVVYLLKLAGIITGI